MFKRLVIVALLGAAPLSSSLAAMYKWLDDDGNVVYSARKPADKSVTEVKKHSGGPSDEAARQNLESLRERATTEKKDRDFQAEYATQQDERKERLKKNCEIARENIRILQTASRVKDVDDDGNPYFVDDGAREARMERAREQVKQNCD